MTIHHRQQVRQSRRRSNRRRGTALVAALVCLLIVMAIMGQMLRGTLSMRRQLQVERDVRQTELLLQSGADRAAVQLSRDGTYQRETWKLPAEAISGSGEGQVSIEVAPTANEKSWQIKVVAEYPLGRESSIRRTRILSIPSHTTELGE